LQKEIVQLLKSYLQKIKVSILFFTFVNAMSWHYKIWVRTQTDGFNVSKIRTFLHVLFVMYWRRFPLKKGTTHLLCTTDLRSNFGYLLVGHTVQIYWYIDPRDQYTPIKLSIKPWRTLESPSNRYESLTNKSHRIPKGAGLVCFGSFR
jgi:hypothetical protein